MLQLPDRPKQHENVQVTSFQKPDQPVLFICFCKFCSMVVFSPAQVSQDVQASADQPSGKIHTSGLALPYKLASCFLPPVSCPLIRYIGGQCPRLCAVIRCQRLFRSFVRGCLIERIAFQNTFFPSKQQIGIFYSSVPGFHTEGRSTRAVNRSRVADRSQ